MSRKQFFLTAGNHIPFCIDHELKGVRTLIFSADLPKYLLVYTDNHYPELLVHILIVNDAMTDVKKIIGIGREHPRFVCRQKTCRIALRKIFIQFRLAHPNASHPGGPCRGPGQQVIEHHVSTLRNNCDALQMLFGIEHTTQRLAQLA